VQGRREHGKITMTKESAKKKANKEIKDVQSDLNENVVHL
jgi:hypothetical protein